MLEKVERSQKVDYYKETVHLVPDNSFITKGLGLVCICMYIRFIVFFPWNKGWT